MSPFSERLRFAINTYGAGKISYKSFASLVDIPYRTLQNYLSGERSPNIEALEKLSNIGIDINWLLTGRENPFGLDNTEKKGRPFSGYLLNKDKTLLNKNVDNTDNDEKYKSLIDIILREYITIAKVINVISNENNYTLIDDIENFIPYEELITIFGTIPKLYILLEAIHPKLKNKHFHLLDPLKKHQ